MIIFLFYCIVFDSSSGFKGTLCGGAWLSLTGGNNDAFRVLGSGSYRSKAKYGCCDPYNYMSTPSTTSTTFNKASQCSSCPAPGGPTVLNDDTDYYIDDQTGCFVCTTCGTGTRETTACSSTTNRVCTQNVCSCTNGVAAALTDCTAHGAHICTSCSSEYYKTSDTCTGCTTCASGRYKTGTPCDGSGSTDTQECTTCTSCGLGQYKKGLTCTGSTTNDTQSCAACLNGGSSYSCLVGQYVNGNACPGSGYTDTQTCNDCVTGKYQTQNVKMKRRCKTCSFGQSATSAATAACSVCASGQSQEKGKTLFTIN